MSVHECYICVICILLDTYSNIYIYIHIYYCIVQVLLCHNVLVPDEIAFSYVMLRSVGSAVGAARSCYPQLDDLCLAVHRALEEPPRSRWARNGIAVGEEEVAVPLLSRMPFYGRARWLGLMQIYSECFSE